MKILDYQKDSNISDSTILLSESEKGTGILTLDDIKKHILEWKNTGNVIYIPSDDTSNYDIQIPTRSSGVSEYLIRYSRRNQNQSYGGGSIVIPSNMIWSIMLQPVYINQDVTANYMGGILYIVLTGDGNIRFCFKNHISIASYSYEIKIEILYR